VLYITPPLDPLDDRNPTYVRCDRCSFFDFGESAYVETYRGAPCPQCEAELTPERQLRLWELEDGSGEWVSGE